MILQDDGPDLADLVGFCVPAVALQVDALLDPAPAKDKVAAAGSLLEPKMPKQTSKIVEIDVGVRHAAADAVGKVLISTHGGDCSLGEGEGSVGKTRSLGVDRWSMAYRSVWNT